MNCWINLGNYFLFLSRHPWGFADRFHIYILFWKKSYIKQLRSLKLNSNLFSSLNRFSITRMNCQHLTVECYLLIIFIGRYWLKTWYRFQKHLSPPFKKIINFYFLCSPSVLWTQRELSFMQSAMRHGKMIRVHLFTITLIIQHLLVPYPGLFAL